MRRALLLLAAAALGGCATSRVDGEARQERAEGVAGPEAGLTAPDSAVDVVLDTGTRPLGAYTVTLVYDGALVRVSDIGPSPAFRLPDYGERGLVSGELTLSAYQLRPNPTGSTVVARVTFVSHGGAASDLRVRLVNLYDPEGVPIDGTARVSRTRVP
jgi:hypothetical protein